MFFNSILFLVIGFGQAANSFIGYFYNKGLYKILHETPFAAIGVFETSFLLGLIGFLLFRAAIKKIDVQFYFGFSASVHLLLALANIAFWNDTFPLNNAEVSGVISTTIHLLLFIIDVICFSSLNKNDEFVKSIV
jgi:hypothetical protein